MEEQKRRREEYMVSLEEWLRQAHHWQCVAAHFPLVLASHLNNTQQPLLRHQQPAPQHAGVEYSIPPLWKRFVAEFLDFIILFVVKLMVTFIAVDYFDIVDIDKYDFDLLHPNVKINYKMALQMTSEIVMLELVHRLVVCVFETLCLHRGHRSVGGATPGKSLMGIKVVLCDRVTVSAQPPPAANNASGVGWGRGGGTRVRVSPASDLGLWLAFCRSVIKNFSLAFFVPISFTLFVFQHNRTAYDILCRSIVVEDLQPTPA